MIFFGFFLSIFLLIFFSFRNFPVFFSFGRGRDFVFCLGQRQLVRQLLEGGELKIKSVCCCRQATGYSLHCIYIYIIYRKIVIDYRQCQLRLAQNCSSSGFGLPSVLHRLQKAFTVVQVWVWGVCGVWGVWVVVQVMCYLYGMLMLGLGMFNSLKTKRRTRLGQVAKCILLLCSFFALFLLFFLLLLLLLRLLLLLAFCCLTCLMRISTVSVLLYYTCVWTYCDVEVCNRIQYFFQYVLYGIFFGMYSSIQYICIYIKTASGSDVSPVDNLGYRAR